MRIRRGARNAIAAHALRDSPREGCGLLLGTSVEVWEAVAITNVADDPHRRYELSPAEHLAQIRRCRELTIGGGVAVGIVGAYHSHPRSAPEPSPTDLEQAFQEFLYVIAGPADGSAGLDIRAYWLKDGRFEPEPLTVVEPPAGAFPRATER